MSKSKLNSFCREFVAILTGDDAVATAEKAWRQAKSALDVQIAALKGDIVNKEDAVESAAEELKLARVNNGKLITDRGDFINNLLKAKNNLTLAEKAVADHQAKIEFLEQQLVDLSKE